MVLSPMHGQNSHVLGGISYVRIHQSGAQMRPSTLKYKRVGKYRKLRDPQPTCDSSTSRASP